MNAAVSTLSDNAAALLGVTYLVLPALGLLLCTKMPRKPALGATSART